MPGCRIEAVRADFTDQSLKLRLARVRNTFIFHCYVTPKVDFPYGVGNRLIDGNSTSMPLTEGSTVLFFVSLADLEKKWRKIGGEMEKRLRNCRAN